MLIHCLETYTKANMEFIKPSAQLVCGKKPLPTNVTINSPLELEWFRIHSCGQDQELRNSFTEQPYGPVPRRPRGVRSEACCDRCRLINDNRSVGSRLPRKKAHEWHMTHTHCWLKTELLKLFTVLSTLKYLTNALTGLSFKAFGHYPVGHITVDGTKGCGHMTS